MKLLLSLLIIVFSFSCTDTPRRTLSEAERLADMNWLISKFEHNYAPRKYKEKLHNFSYEEVKKDFIEASKQDQTNEEFFRLLNSFLAVFKDAHTSGSFSVSPLPGRSSVSYLGFTGKRLGDAFKVTGLMPTVDKKTFLIKKGDKIISLDDLPLKVAVDEKLTKYRDLGSDEANYSILMGSLFARAHNTFAPSEKKIAKLKVKRGSKEIEINLPWIVKDLHQYREDLRLLPKASLGVEQNIVEGLEQAFPSKYFSKSKFLEIIKSSLSEDDLFENIREMLSKMTIESSFELNYSEFFSDMLNLRKATEEFTAMTTRGEEVKRESDREFKLLEKFTLSHAKTYETHIFAIKKDKVYHNIGYIRVNTFSPANSTGDVIKEIKKSLKLFTRFNVDKILLDLIDNGGGSLELGSKMAQLFSKTKIKLPFLELKPNENWLDSIERKSIDPSVSDPIRVISSEVLVKLLSAYDNEKVISAPVKSEEVFPLILENSSSFLKYDQFQIAILANEKCASMCDIFSAIMQDNKLAKVLGVQTMGAGGNVVRHYSAPNSGFMINLTESLVKRSNGEYLENNGVMPDKEIKTYNDSSQKYYDTVKEAFDYLIDNMPVESKSE